MLGREVNTSAYLMLPQPAVESQTTDQFIAKLKRNIQAAHSAARQTLKTSLKRMKRNYDLRGILRRPFNKEEIVYLWDMAVLKGKCRKLCRPWKGPTIIVQKISSSLFRVQLHKSMFVVNHDRMKLCKGSALPDCDDKRLKDPEVQEETISDDKNGILLL